MAATISGSGTSTLIDLTTSGNTILGDASTDTLNVGNGGLVKDASGNVGIGTNAPRAGYNLTVGAGGTGAVDGTINLDGSSASAQGSGIRFARNSTATGYIGTASWLIGGTSSDLVFSASSAGTEAMRIDSSGNLLVGTTSSSLTSGAGHKIIVTDASNPYTGQVFTSATNSYTTHHLYSTGAAAYRFYVGGAGTVFATTTTISSLSDARLKENIRDLDDGLEKVMALQPRKFDWKEGKGQNIKDARGFVAQEFETVFPDMIDEWKDPAPEGEEPYKSVNANLIPTLVKAIQEQQAIITQLQADVAALKGTA